MANNLQSNPIILTGSMSQGYKAATASALGTLRTLIVEKVYWFNPQTAGNTITIGDPISGETLLQLRCETANQSQILDWTSSPRLWQDFEINAWTDVGSTLYIYTR